MVATYRNYIGGEWVPAASGRTFEDPNPANREDILGVFPRSDQTDNGCVSMKPAESSRTTRWAKRALWFVPVALVLAVGLLIGVRVKFDFPYLIVDIAPSLACKGNTCREPDPDVVATYKNFLACDLDKPGVCLVPTGATSKESIETIADDLRAILGVDIQIAPPMPLPADTYDRARGQFSAGRITDYLLEQYATADGVSQRLLVAVTPVDIYTSRIPHWRYAFGTQGKIGDGSTVAVISTYQMYSVNAVHILRLPLVLIYDRNYDRREERAEKLLTKYAGYALFDLKPSNDPKSVMYNNILGVDDLDRMGDTLPPHR